MSGLTRDLWKPPFSSNASICVQNFKAGKMKYIVLGLIIAIFRVSDIKNDIIKGVYIIFEYDKEILNEVIYWKISRCNPLQGILGFIDLVQYVLMHMMHVVDWYWVHIQALGLFTFSIYSLSHLLIFISITSSFQPFKCNQNSKLLTYDSATRKECGICLANTGIETPSLLSLFL